MWLSSNFHLSEMTKSQTASRLGISNQPSEEHLQNMIALCENVLEKIKDVWQKPVMVSSGYRSPALNKAVGGSATSQHCNGQAADIEIYDVDNCVLAQWISETLEFDQLILEFHDHEKGPNDGWVHISYNIAGNRQQVLTAKRMPDGSTRYFEGLKK